MPDLSSGPPKTGEAGAEGSHRRPADQRDQRAAMAAQVRRLVTLVVGRPLDDDALDRAAEDVRQLADALEAKAGPGKASRPLPDPTSGPAELFPTSPVIGRANPLAPPAQVWWQDGELRGRVRFAYAYEGPPTCVHGGVIAAVFDEILGAALIMNGNPGMTGTLTVRYRRPTPLQADIDLVARPTGVDGRKLYVEGALYYAGELTAEAEAVFIKVPPETMAGIVGSNERRADAPVVDERLRAYMGAGGEVLAAE